MARAGLDLNGILRDAMTIADSDGLEALTMVSLASRLKVKAPSLYNHIQSLDMVRDELTRRGWLMLLDQTRDALAGVSGHAALKAFCRAQRKFAKEHPGLWRATQLAVSEWSDATRKVTDAYLALVLKVLRGYAIKGDPALHAARGIRAAVRGFIDLELGGGFSFPQDVDVSFRRLLKMLDAGLRSPENSKE